MSAPPGDCLVRIVPLSDADGGLVGVYLLVSEGSISSILLTFGNGFFFSSCSPLLSAIFVKWLPEIQHSVSLKKIE
jgi:hypothetical protein